MNQALAADRSVLNIIKQKYISRIYLLSQKKDQKYEKTDRRVRKFGPDILPFGRRNREREERAVRLLNDYGDSIFRFAYSFLHNREDAEDVVQETLIRVLNAPVVFESSAHEKAYLLRTAANLSKNILARQKAHPQDELPEELAAEEREDLSFIWDAVKQLPDRWREVIHLFYYEGYSSAEIAVLLSRNESTVRSDLSRGRAKLKEMLKGAYHFEES